MPQADLQHLIAQAAAEGWTELDQDKEEA